MGVMLGLIGMTALLVLVYLIMKLMRGDRQ